MTSKLVVNTIEADTGISSVSFASSISMSSTSKFHFSNAGIDIGADTNINRPAAGVLGFNINSGEKFRIASDGKLGINITSPTTIIHASGNNTVGTSVTMRLQSHDTANATAGIDLLARRNDNVNETCKIQAASGGQNSVDLQFFTNNTERLRIKSDGTIRASGGAFTDTDIRLVLTNPTTNSGSQMQFQTNSTGSSSSDGLRVGYNGSGAQMWLFENQYIRFATNNTERLHITADGDVAIGRDAALNNYAAGSTTTQLAVVKDGGAAGSGYHEVAHFTGGNDSDDTGAIVRITQFNNDRGLYIKGGRGTGNNAKAIFGLRNSSNVDNDVMSLLEGGQLVVNGDTNIGHPNMDDIIVGDASGNRGITIASGSGTNFGSVAFGDSTDGSGNDRYEGLIEYYHGDDSLTFYTEHSAKFKILSTSNGGALESASKTITGGNNLAIQNFKVKGVWSGAGSIGKSIELISGYDSSVKMAAVGYNLTDTNTGSTYGGDLTFHTQPLYSSPTTPLPVRMRISSVGHVTKPETPCFIVRHTSAEVYNGGSYIDGPWSATLNRGNHFNVSTGIFTTPVTGLYQLNMMMNNDYNNSSRPGNFKIYVNNSLYAGMQFDPLDSHAGWFTHTLCGTLYISRNDTVRLYTGNTARVDNSNWNHWSMYLIG